MDTRIIYTANYAQKTRNEILLEENLKNQDLRKYKQILPMGKDYLSCSPGTGDAFLKNGPAKGQGFLTSLRCVRNDGLFRWHRGGKQRRFVEIYIMKKTFFQIAAASLLQSL